MSSKPIALKGGLLLSESPLDVYPGSLKDSLNFYESTDGGYERVGGYERHDGRASPAEAIYYLATFNNWATHVNNIVAGANITVGTITMHVIDVSVNVADNTLGAYVCNVGGVIPEDLDIVPVSWDGTSYLTSLTARDTQTTTLDEFYLELAWDYARAAITELPGTGAPSGVLQIEDTVVAFRNDGATPKFYKATPAGWVAGRFGRVLEITGYTADDILPNDTIAGATFRVVAVCDWYDADDIPDVAKAWLVVVPLTGALAPALGASTSNTGKTFTIASVMQPITAFGSYVQYVNCNFMGHPDFISSWFVDGKNTPMCYSHKDHCIVPVSSNFNRLEDIGVTLSAAPGQLKFSNQLGSIVVSEPDAPFNYGGQYGAAVIGVGDYITNIVPVDSSDTVVFTKASAKKLTGRDKSEWVFDPAAGSMGAYHRSAQQLDDVFTLSTRGVCSLIRTETTGGYYGGSISTSIQEVIAGYRERHICSTTITAKEQVRWYFDDGAFLMMSRLPSEADGTNRFAFTLGNYQGKVVRNVSTMVWDDGRERTFFTSDDGFVYEADCGPNFDGNTVYSFVEMHSNHLGSPGQNKAFKRVFFEAQSQNACTLEVTYTINYGEKIFDARSIDLQGGRYVYDSGLYNVALYDAGTSTRAKATLKGKGFNIGFTIEHSGKFALPFKVTGYTLDYENLGKAIK